MKIFSIYKAINKVNDKCYIGFDSSWPHRKMAHKSCVFNNKTHEHNYIFHRAIRKYGWDAFEWVVIYQSKNCDHTLRIMEEYFIKENFSHYKNGFGYNMTYGGEGTLGWIPLKTTRKIWSSQRKGKDNPFYKKTHTKEHIEKISNLYALNYLIFEPNGKSYEIKNLTKFCKENSLSQGAMVAITKGKRKHHKGWKCLKLDKPTVPENINNH